MGESRLSRWNPWRGLGGLPPGSWVLFSTTLINRSGSMVLPFLVLYLTTRLGFPAGRAGLVLAVYGAGALVAAPLAGRLCDRIGAQRLMKTSLFASGGILLLYPLATGWATVLAATILLTVTAESYRPAAMAILTDLVPPQQRKAAFSLNRLAVNLGMSVGPAAGGFLAAFSFRGLFWVDGATSILAALLLQARPIRVPVEAGAPPDLVAAGPKRSRPARKDVPYILFLSSAIPVIVVFFQTSGAMSLHVVRNLGLAASFFGLLFTLNTVLIVLLEVRLNFATAHWPHGRSLALGSMLVGVGFGALALCREPWSVLASVIVWTFGEMILLPSMSAHVADLAPADRRGEYMGFYSMAWGIAFSLGPWIGTETLDRFGPRVLWPACFAVSALSALLFWRIRGHGSHTVASGEAAAPSA